MNFQSMVSFKVIIGTLFGLLIAAITVLGVLFFKDSQSRVIAAGRVDHSYQVIGKTEEIYSAYKNALLQASLLTELNDTALAVDYKVARAMLFLRIAELRDLIRQYNEGLSIDSLATSIQQLGRVMDTVSVRFAGSSQSKRALRAMVGSALTKQIDLEIKELKVAEGNTLARRKHALQQAVAIFARTLNMLTIAIAILLAATFLIVRNNFNKRKAAEDQIKDALQAEVELNRLKSSFVTLASHEFRTPLTTILSSAFLLERYLVDIRDDKAAKHVARIKSSVSNLTSILDEFLSVTKIEEGGVKPNLEVVDLPALLSSVCSDLQAFAKSGQIIHYSHAGEQDVKTDPVLLGNIVRNIVTNSIKYSRENSPIYVTSAVNSKIHMAVEDAGIGIPASDQKHLFERFYRASNAGTVQGTGLGLHIMKHYVEMLKGSVKLESAVDKGTRVEVTFDQFKPD